MYVTNKTEKAASLHLAILCFVWVLGKFFKTVMGGGKRSPPVTTPLTTLPPPPNLSKSAAIKKFGKIQAT
ncbi:hypothetical protein [Scytonema sp. PRP1]|uniref:hypothetical protein n=1 Tax=Scytonema sp. PRP1 TaxID=3120513 RepID=UPI00300C0E85